MDFEKYLDPKVMILIPVMYVVGMLLKKTPKVPDALIPYIILATSVLFSFGILKVWFDSLIQGLLVTGLTVLANQLYKQGVEAIGLLQTKDNPK